MTIGPIQTFVIGFRDNDHFDGSIADELVRLSELDQIRVIDAVVVMREGDEIAALSVSELSDEQRTEMRAVVGALVGLGFDGLEGAAEGAETLASLDPDGPTVAEVLAAGVAEELPAGTSALVLAIEHTWAIPLRDAVRDAGGLVLGHRLLTPEDLVVFGADL